MPYSTAELTLLAGGINSTGLNEDESLGYLDPMCRVARESLYRPAALCVYPELFISPAVSKRRQNVVAIEPAMRAKNDR